VWPRRSGPHPTIPSPRFVCGRYPLPRLPKVDQRGQFVDDRDSTSERSGLFNLLLQNLRGVREVVIHDLSWSAFPLCPGAVIRVILAPEAPEYFLSALRSPAGSIAPTAHVTRRTRRLESLQSRLLEVVDAAGARSYHSNCRWEIVGVDRYINSSGGNGSIAGDAGGQRESHSSEIESYLLDGLEGPHRLWKSRAARQGRTLPDLKIMLRDMIKVLSPDDVEESCCRACGDIVPGTSLREAFRSPTSDMHAS
jgi:hypothetical protein